MSKLRKYAKGQPCQVMLPDVCISGGENETTVLAHLPSFGMGTKSPDLLGSHCCAACHDVIDGRTPTDFPPEWLREKHNDGTIRTIRKLYADKVISV